MQSMIPLRSKRATVCLCWRRPWVFFQKFEPEQGETVALHILNHEVHEVFQVDAGVKPPHFQLPHRAGGPVSLDSLWDHLVGGKDMTEIVRAVINFVIGVESVLSLHNPILMVGACFIRIKGCARGFVFVPGDTNVAALV